MTSEKQSILRVVFRSTKLINPCTRVSARRFNSRRLPHSYRASEIAELITFVDGLADDEETVANGSGAVPMDKPREQAESLCRVHPLEREQSTSAWYMWGIIRPEGEGDAASEPSALLRDAKTTRAASSRGRSAIMQGYMWLQTEIRICWSCIGNLDLFLDEAGRVAHNQARWPRIQAIASQLFVEGSLTIVKIDVLLAKFPG